LLTHVLVNDSLNARPEFGFPEPTFDDAKDVRETTGRVRGTRFANVAGTNIQNGGQNGVQNAAFVRVESSR
jgi:hypothetical protein